MDYVNRYDFRLPTNEEYVYIKENLFEAQQDNLKVHIFGGIVNLGFAAGIFWLYFEDFFAGSVTLFILALINIIFASNEEKIVMKMPFEILKKMFDQILIDKKHPKIMIMERIADIEFCNPYKDGRVNAYLNIPESITTPEVKNEFVYMGIDSDLPAVRPTQIPVYVVLWRGKYIHALPKP